MLDESLPTFYLRKSKDSVKHDATLYLSQFGNEASPAYTLRHPDPASPDAKNRYAAALCDSYNPDILYGEVLLIPEWTQPTLSQEDVRRNGGVPPPPQPILPNEFTIQLYNPDQQVVVRNKASTWNTAQHWEFEVPQQTFRKPSASTLDRTQNDPSALESTPTIDLKWKREGKMSKDLTCNLSGKSKNPDGSKRKQKEPDIPIAFFRSMREVTIMEPNLQRIEVEDPKGFEVVLLLGAIAIKDVYFGQMRDVFNIDEPARRRKLSSPRPLQVQVPATTRPLQSTQQPQAQARHNNHGPAKSYPAPSQPQRPAHSIPAAPASSSRPPPTDPRSQWEIDAESSRLRRVSETDDKERRKREKEDAKKAKQLADEEARAARQRQESVDREHEQLRQEYFAEQRRLQAMQPAQPLRQGVHNGRSSVPSQLAHPQQYRPAQPSPQVVGAYLQPYRPGVGIDPSASSGNLLGGQAQAYAPAQGQARVKPKKSGFLGLGRSKDENRLLKKRSAVF
jgi:hypothetical protein